MQKNFVLDTNVLIHDPNCIYKFDDNNIYIPHPVIEELDSFKNDKNERGYNVREVSRKIKELRKQGNLINGVNITDKGKLYTFVAEDGIFEKHWLPSGWKKDKMDNIILLSVKQLAEKHDNVILVTNDGNMQLKADFLGIPVEEYKNDRLMGDNGLYSGKSIRFIDNELMAEFFARKKIMIPKDDSMFNVTENEYVILRSSTGGSALSKYKNGYLYALNQYERCPMDVKARNASQKFLMESLLTNNEDIPLTICNGPAGTGKTLLALAAGLEQVMEEKKYKRVLICRANVTMDEEIGFLPGSEQDKISPLLRGVYDNLEYIFGNKDDTVEEIEDKIKEPFQRGYLTAQSLAYLRGRSIADTYIIIDEAQNCTPNQMLSIITRAGLNTKIVLLGDINQVDNFRLDTRNNGLSFAIEKMKGSVLCDVITFDEEDCTRSLLAKEASDRLKV